MVWLAELAGAVKLVSKAFDMLSAATATVQTLEPGRAVIALRNTWAFPEVYQVGVFEGAMRGFDESGEVRVAVHSACDVDIEMRWGG